MTFDPEDFRIKVGNNKERWYMDPLPACPVAPAAPDWKAPAVSTIKSASSKDWTMVAIQRAAEWVFRHDISFDGQDSRSIASLLSQANSNALDLASARGTQIHRVFEVYAQGGDWRNVELGYEAQAYRNTVARIIDKMQPEIVLSEFIAINRGVGYGGTGDATWRIDGDLWLVDYKTRTENQAVYIEEAWQVSAYAKAEYYIAEGRSGDPVRIVPPEYAGGLILSITPTDFQFYPVDLDRAWPGFLTLRDHWQHRHDGKHTIFGKTWTVLPTRDEWIRDRIAAIKAVDVNALVKIWPATIARPKNHPEPYDDGEVDELDVALGFAEKHLSIPFGAPDPAKVSSPPADPATIDTWLHNITGTVHNDSEPTDGPAMPDEGELQPASLPIIKARFDGLRGPQQDWIGTLVVQARDAELPIRVADNPTERRVAIAKALIRAAEDKLDEPTIKAALEAVLHIEPPMELGVGIGMMNAAEAKAFLELIKMAQPARQEDTSTAEVAPKGAPVEKISPKEKAKPATLATPPRKKPAKKAPAKKAASTKRSK